jgi:hypothetical protein
MLLRRTTDQTSLTLSVEGYEHPDEPLGPTDDNPADEFETSRFLVVAVRFSTPQASWSVAGPYLTTGELAGLADWFDSIARGAPSAQGICFIERDMEFTIDEAASRLTVHLLYRFLPPGDGSQDIVQLEFPLQEVDLGAAAKDLRETLRKFPGRPPLVDRDSTA